MEVFALTIISLHVAVSADVSVADCDRNGRIFSARYNVGNGIGFHESYATASTFLPTQINCDEHLYAFLDARYHIFNDGRSAANVGFGGRMLCDSFNMVVGTNLYYDYRKTRHYNYHQIGIGTEVLGPCLDFRINGYLPIKTKSHAYDIHVSKICDNTFKGFTNNGILIGGEISRISNKREYAFGGVDAELGAYLYQNPCFDIYAALGSYYYRSKHKNVLGGSFRLCADVTKYTTLQVLALSDNVFHNNVGASVAINIPLWGWFDKLQTRATTALPADCQVACCERWLDTRLVQAVHRNEIIVTKSRCQHTVKQDPDRLAIDPDTGQPVNFIFVNNTNLNPGDGSFDNPYNTLQLAQNNSTTGDTIYVFSGNGTSSGMDVGFTLKDNQQIYGSCAEIALQSQCGTVIIPGQTTEMPVVTNIAGNAFDLANNNIVDCFHILDPSGNGISGNAINNVLIRNNQITDPQGGMGINLVDSIGTLNIIENTISGLPATIFGSAGINVENTLTSSVAVNIFNNTVDQFFEGIQIFALSKVNLTTSVIGNTLTNSNSIGIDVNGFCNSEVTATISHNQVSDINGVGAVGIVSHSDCYSSMVSLVDSNIVSRTTAEGINVSTGNGAFLCTTVSNNTLISNGGAGGIVAQTSNTPQFGDILCLRLLNNNSSTGYFIHNFTTSSTTLNFEPSVGNVGTITTLGVITNVPAGFCEANGCQAEPVGLCPGCPE